MIKKVQLQEFELKTSRYDIMLVYQFIQKNLNS